MPCACTDDLNAAGAAGVSWNLPRRRCGRLQQALTQYMAPVRCGGKFKLVEDPLSEELLAGDLKAGGRRYATLPG